MATIRVIAAVVDVKQLTLYKEDGSIYEIPQGDDRLAPILAEITPILEADLIAEVDTMEVVVPEDTTYRDYEEQTGGFTKFFRVLKHKAKALFGTDDNVAREPAKPVAPRKVGTLPSAPRPPVSVPAVQELVQDPESTALLLKDKVPEPEKPKASSAMSAAIEDIMAHAQPVSAPTYKEADTTKEHTIVAVTKTKEGATSIVPGVENLKNHIKHATKLKDAVGMTAFLQRLGAAIESRDHSVQDVLTFMERGDLPLADDGSIIAYKVLMTSSNDKDTFVDCHTRGVTQKVGSLVCMDIKLVDRNRAASCSYGLHIARRGYLRNSSGNIMVLCKIAPEDVIAVPHGDANKVRVRAYHIIARVPDAEHQNLRDGKPFQTEEGQRLLTMAIKGDHAPAWQQVEIVSHTSTPGGKVNITNLLEAPVAEPVAKAEVAPTPSIPDPVRPDAPKPLTAPVVDPKALAKEVDARKTNAPATKAEQARVLFNAKKFSELWAFKKAAKKSWFALGFTTEEENQINPKAPADTDKGLSDLAKLTQFPTETITTADLKPKVSHTVPVTPPEKRESGIVAEKKEVKMSGTRAEVARMLFDRAAGGDKSAWGSLWIHQKQAKKSWAILGFTPKEIERIKVNKPDHV